MTDKTSRLESLIERLRYDANNPPALPWPTPLLDEAADALERLRKGFEEASDAEVAEYSLEEALHLARLWRAGKLIGGDSDAVIQALLTEIERLTFHD